MKKRLLSLLITLAICFSTFSIVPASAASSYSFCPINYDTYVTHNSAGTSELNMILFNNTGKTIQSFEIIAYPKDSYGRSLSLYDWGTSYSYKGIAQDIYIEGYDYYDSIYWNMYGFDNATSNTTAKITSVLFSDGTIWENPGSPYQEANFFIGNDCTPDGAYILEDDHKMYLLDTSCSSYARDWYIWDDSVSNWVWFSDEIIATAAIWTPAASIKLVINNNPNLYKVFDFTVAQAPKFNILLRNTGTLKSSSDDYNNFYVSSFYKTTMPYVFDLWDLNNVTSRDWYLWDDAVNDWVWFSDAQGPYCHVWSEGAHSIKLVYNKNPYNYLIYDFVIDDASR